MRLFGSRRPVTAGTPLEGAQEMRLRRVSELSASEIQASIDRALRMFAARPPRTAAAPAAGGREAFARAGIEKKRRQSVDDRDGVEDLELDGRRLSPGERDASPRGGRRARMR